MKYPTELRERAVRMVPEHQHEYGSQWETICSVAEKLGPTPQTVLTWVRHHETDSGSRPGVTSDELAQLKELKKENRELRRAHEILKAASAFLVRNSTASQRSSGVHRRSPRPVRSRVNLSRLASA